MISMLPVCKICREYSKKRLMIAIESLNVIVNFTVIEKYMLTEGTQINHMLMVIKKDK